MKITEKEGESIISEKRYVWDSMEIVEERAADGETVLKQYFPQGFSINHQQSTFNCYYAKDHLGGIRAVVDSSGVERGRWDYDLWGQRGENQIETDAVEVDFTYTGHFYHAFSGLIMAPYRSYWPEIGRWLEHFSKVISEKRIGKRLF